MVSAQRSADAPALELDLPTSRGPARALVHLPDSHPPRGLVVLGHGAGGGAHAPDLQALRDLADEGWAVALLEQPWRVAGRRVAGPPAHLDDAWLEAVPAVQAAVVEATSSTRLPLVTGGRSAGARVACRTAASLHSAAVVALAFPLHPPTHPERTRGPELCAPGKSQIPVLVVQGERDRFGGPAAIEAAAQLEGTPTGSRAPRGDRHEITIAPVRGDHSLDTDTAAVASAVTSWLDGLRLG